MPRRSIALTLALATSVVAAAFLVTARMPDEARGQEVEPRPAPAPVLLDPNDTVILLLDHQTGLFQTVKDVPIRELRANTVVLAKIAALGKAPIFTTASEPRGTNGPLMAELAEAAPNAV